MDVLPFSRPALKFLGIQVSPKQSRLQRCWNYFIATYGITTMAVSLAGLLYVLLLLDKVLVACLALIAMSAIKLVTHITTLCQIREIFSVLETVIRGMDNSAIKKIERFDRFHGTLKVLFDTVVMILLTVYLSMTGFGPETAALLVGLRSKQGESLTFQFFPLIVLNFGFLMFALLIQFYESCLFIVTLVADQARHHCMQTSIVIDYDLIKKSLQKYNNLMQTVNCELGIVPMALLSMEFAMFSSGISFMITSSGDVGVSIYFAVLTIGALNGVCLWSIFHVIALSSECYKKISSAWAMAEESVADPFALMTSEETVRTRKSLKFFLLSESIVPVKAADSIVIDRTLVLSFFSQLIPFTVMMFTTIKEVDLRAANTKSN